MDALLGDIKEGKKSVQQPIEDINTRVLPGRESALLSYFYYNNNLDKLSCRLCRKTYKHYPGYLHALTRHMKMNHEGQLQRTLEALNTPSPHPSPDTTQVNTGRQTHLVRSPFQLPEPEWIPNKERSLCMECQEDFSFFKRRHHCRRCGHLFCSSCTDKKLALPRMCLLDPVRHCDACAKVTSEENYFYNKDLKTLIEGASIYLDLDSGDEPVLRQCHLSMDHQHLIVEKDGSEVPKVIPMHQILTTSVTSTDSNCHTFQMQYTLVEGGKEEYLRVPMAIDAPISMIQFVTALQRAVFMMQEARVAIDAKG